MTKEIRTVEFVVLPTSKAKARKMFQIAGACRYVWNHFREKNLSDYQKFRDGEGEGPSTSYFSLGVEFTKLRHRTHWLRELPEAEKQKENRPQLHTSQQGEFRDKKAGRKI